MAKVYRVVKIKDIQTTYHMRTKLDEDWALHLGALYEANADPPPPKVRELPNGKYEMIQGRHRVTAADLTGRTELRVEVLNCNAKTALKIAFRDSIDPKVSLQLRKKDIVHSIAMMLEKGLTRVQVLKELEDKFPASVAKRYYTDARSNLTKRQVGAAINYRKEYPDIDLTDLAKKFKVRPTTLLKALDKENPDRPPGIPELKGGLTQSARKFTKRVRDTLERLRMSYSEGQITESQLSDCIKHTLNLADQVQKSCLEEKGRVSSLLLRGE
jgi:ParB-like chromosome segregation protein Spo0J